MRGRYSKINTGLVEAILIGIENGKTIQEFCDIAGITTQTFFNWMHLGASEKSDFLHKRLYYGVKDLEDKRLSVMKEKMVQTLASTKN